MIKLYGGTWSRKVCQNEESRLTGSYKNNIAKFHCMFELVFINSISYFSQKLTKMGWSCKTLVT